MQIDTKFREQSCINLLAQGRGKKKKEKLDPLGNKNIKIKKINKENRF